MITVVRAGYLFDGRAQRLKEDPCLLISDGRIAAIGGSSIERGREAGQVLDLRPYTLLPGLIDAHVHLIWSGLADAINDFMGKTEAELAVTAAANLKKALASGVTAIRDCGARASVIFDLAERLRRGEIAGPRMVCCGAPITTPGGHCWYLGLETKGIAGAVKAVEEMQRRGADFIKVMVTGGGSTPGTDVRRSQFHGRELGAIADRSRQLGLDLTGHAHGTEGIKMAVEAGFSGIEHCSWLDPAGEGYHYERKTARELVEKGIFVCRTIAGFERWSLDDIAIMKERCVEDYQKARRAYEPLRRMAEDGVRLVAGTDAGINNTGFDGLAVSLETMVGLGGMTPFDALRSATCVAAGALGLDSQIGTLEAGKYADCIAVEGNPLRDLRALHRIKAVLKDGEIAFRA